MSEFNRRKFVQASMAAGAAGILRPAAALADGPTLAVGGLDNRLFKSIKVGMIEIDGSLTEKFLAAKAAGFAAVEMDSPGMDVDQTNVAIRESGVPVDGTVCSTHWKIRHSSPNAEERDAALRDLKTAVRDTHAVGGSTVLLVNGHGDDGAEADIWPRSLENISKAVPLAARLGVVIAIENVWNHFLYDHNGDSHQTADRFAKYVDEFQSPWVGLQFDIGNHWKFGSMGDWIRQLGKRIVKLDVKGFSREKDQFTKIGEGDVDWTDIRSALEEIDFYGWCAAEVAGGGPDRLTEISRNLDQVFGLRRNTAE